MGVKVDVTARGVITCNCLLYKIRAFSLLLLFFMFYVLRFTLCKFVTAENYMLWVTNLYIIACNECMILFFILIYPIVFHKLSFLFDYRLRAFEKLTR